MTIDERVAERRRFARALGTDPELGSGLPIGTEFTRDRRLIEERSEENGDV